MFDVSKDAKARFLRTAVAAFQERLLLETKLNFEIDPAKLLDEQFCQRLIAYVGEHIFLY